MSRWIVRIVLGLAAVLAFLGTFWIVRGSGGSHAVPPAGSSPSSLVQGGPASTFLLFVAERLNLSPDVLLAQLEGGKTLAEVIEERGEDPQTVADDFLATRVQEYFRRMAGQGIPQEEVEKRLRFMEQLLQVLLYEPFPVAVVRGGGAEAGSRYARMVEEMTRLLGLEGAVEMFQEMDPTVMEEMMREMGPTPNP